ncbi:O-linked N-acetylglucosamine transferase family protein [Desulfopila aestuarii]|uniref:protein O-GlcNAc transferase n=1 Tax=Desulfopila aestuarii DSM 18488 TaxID=1121416 RepID=A0A1M7YHY4_9BACT|nr:methyltransferase domain-containing protein [Desulfopila aestuarii]SHO52257.1 Methyltransferase domain-containing protein [Desulfopila aestuarii DSM 18488]
MISLLQQAQAAAQIGDFAKMQFICRQIMDTQHSDIATLLDVGSILMSSGFLTDAQQCFDRSLNLGPHDLRALVNLANLQSAKTNHEVSRQSYQELLEKLPSHPIVRRNLLISLEYDPQISDTARLQHARDWGLWAIGLAGGRRSRPAFRHASSRPLRLGYVSADFCQHTVGLFIKDVLATHDNHHLNIYTYSAGHVHDWVTTAIRDVSNFRDVTTFDDTALAQRIELDNIDILIDLSGHTAGSRLTMFAHRPAPVMISWLGYFATTGLEYIDAVLLDEYHAPPGTESQFLEPIVRLPQGRFCYTPVSWASSKISPAPFQHNGHITFGCFNNTSKFNEIVYELWTDILLAVPGSRLILKWRTFNDENFRQQVTQCFLQRGISTDRIELRGPSFHAQLLREYADIDIALDPFPFTGGLTSCEALWMGVPVITWPQNRVVSRQTFAFLSAIGLTELAAKDATDYVGIAAALANDHQKLLHLRQNLRRMMAQSSLCDVVTFTRSFEETLKDLYHTIMEKEQQAELSATTSSKKTLLNVGAGHPKSGAKVPAFFHSSDWRVVRLDIDPANTPDILGTMLDMSAVQSESIDAIYSSHNIEHLYPSEIPKAIQEFLRVLKPEGYAVITCPDLQAAAQMISDDKLMEVAYTSPAGPVTPFDIVYSHRQFTRRDNPFMAHHCGFTLTVLIGTLKANGFISVAGKRRPPAFDLWVLATKNQMDETELRSLAGKILPA